jgi:hypothetical protein
LPRARKLCLENAQRCSFLIMEQCCGPLAVEIVPGKHCYISTYLTKIARAQSGTCAEVQIRDYGTFLWSPGSRNCSIKAGKHSDFSTKLTKRARAQFGACAEVHFPDYKQCSGPLAVEIVPGNTGISAPILPTERELSLAHAQRCNFLIMEQSCGP